MYVDAMDYAKNVAGKLSKIPSKEYFRRKDRDTKQLIDEEWPLATFGKILYHPNRIVEIEYYGNKSTCGYDAKIKLTGSQRVLEGWDEETPVEITTVYYENAHLVRKELFETGVSFGPSSIKRLPDGRTRSECIPRDSNSSLEKQGFISNVINNLKEKYKKDYPDNCIVLCALFPEISPWIGEWKAIIEAVHSEIGKGIKYNTYLIDTFYCRSFNLRKSVEPADEPDWLAQQVNAADAAAFGSLA